MISRGIQNCGLYCPTRRTELQSAADANEIAADSEEASRRR